MNVIRVDWSELARSVNYLAAANRVPDAGKILGQFIDFLHFYNAIDFDKIMIVGFSLGGNGNLDCKFNINFYDFISSRRRFCWQKCATWQNSHNHRTRSSW